ncbi:MAG: preprotein translocase subunit SecE [SAR202 cluster bacterium]|nr:preprotein translocase subunit SecE [SAR202 cluster bacterium]
MASAQGRNPLRSVMDEGGGGPPRRRFQFVGEIVSELGKVTWPSRQDATRLTVLVLAVAGVVGVFLALWDLGFTQLVERVLLRQ